MEPSRKRTKGDYTWDSELCTGPYAYSRTYRCWRPIHGVHVSKSSYYNKFSNIARILHFEDHKAVHKKQTLIPSIIQQESHSSMPIGLEGVWFGISSKSREQHNWYGNVACEIDFNVFLETFMPKCYFIEVVEYATNTASRMLLTTQDLPGNLDIPEYNPACIGGPWYKHPVGGDKYLQYSRKFQSEDEIRCAVEFFIILSEEERNTLYEKCNKVAVNHELANDGNVHRCRKYRSGRKKLTCLTPWNIATCEENLSSLEDGNPDANEDTEDNDEDEEEEDLFAGRKYEDDPSDELDPYDEVDPSDEVDPYDEVDPSDEVDPYDEVDPSDEDVHDDEDDHDNDD